MRYIKVTMEALAISEKQQHDIHHKTLQETGFWGKQAAGCLFLAKDTGRILFNHRSSRVEQPLTWGTWGGALDEGEDPLEGMRREVKEEAGFKGRVQLIPLAVFKHKSGFRYFNFLAIVKSEFKPVLDWESKGAKWVEFGDWPAPLHTGAKYLIDKSAKDIKRIIKNLHAKFFSSKRRD